MMIVKSILNLQDVGIKCHATVKLNYFLSSENIYLLYPYLTVVDSEDKRIIRLVQ